jgi:hypothetical protein
VVAAHLPPGSLGYHACDIDQRLVALVNDFLRHIGLPQQASVLDIMWQPLELDLPEEPDIVFL